MLPCSAPCATEPTCGSSRPDEMVAAVPDDRHRANPFCFAGEAVRIVASMREVGVVPDLVFGLHFADGSRRYFMVEIDRGTMPVVRTNMMQTSFERKMRAYLAAHAAKQHERHFGWKTFPRADRHDRRHASRSMREALRTAPCSPQPRRRRSSFSPPRANCARPILLHMWPTAMAGVSLI